jgi:TRAP-type C4-dicarboxylate transport system permease small subunit
VNRVTKVLHTICGFVTLSFFLLTFFQIVMRYLLNHPIYGIEEAVVVLVIWTCALGMAIVYWNNEHPKLTVLMDWLPSFIRITMHYVTSIIVFILGWFFAKGGMYLFKVQLKVAPVGGLPFCKAYYYALPLIVAGILLLIMSAVRVFRYIVTGNEQIMQMVPEEGGVSVD